VEEGTVKTRTPLLSALALAGLLLAACGEGTGSAFTTSPASTPSSASTASSAAVTTTTAVSTTTTTTITTTTTTIPSTLGPPPVPLQFLADGLGIVDFGASPEDAVAIVGAYLGSDPTADSGWGPAWGDYGACPGNEYRQVEFQGLALKFTDAGLFQPAGTRQFFAYSYDGNPPGIAFGQLDIGTTVADLQALYPTVTVYPADEIFGPTFRVEGAGSQQLWGLLTGTGPADTVTFLTGGWGCGE
jgi:hypothetical protein